MSDNCSAISHSTQAAMSTELDCPAMAATPHRTGLGLNRPAPKAGVHRRRSQSSYSRFFILALCSSYLAAEYCQRGHVAAFSTPSYATRPRTHAANLGSPSSAQIPPSMPATRPVPRRATPQTFMSSVADVPAQSHSPRSPDDSSRLSNYQRRMKALIKRNSARSGMTNSAPTRRTIGTGTRQQRPANLKTVNTLGEYKDAIDQDRGKIIVVRFFATWCKACKAIQPSFYRLASLYPQITFLEVPVTNQNVNLHQGLGVPSLPYGHIYYPDAGLVEELKISKKYFHNLVKNLRWYNEGQCSLEDYVPETEREKDNQDK